jgi:hypothetical protein
MGTAQSPQPYQKESPEYRWPDVLYLAMVLVSVTGLAYLFLKS